MTCTPSISNLLRSALAVVFAGIWMVDVHAQAATGEPIEIRELKAALEVAQDQLVKEQKQSAEIEAQRKTLIESLSEAVRVSEEQMISSRENQLKLQAFGVDLFTQDDKSLEQRLLKAVRDLDIAQQEIERQSSAIRQLSEEFLKFVKSAPQLSDNQIAEAEAAISVAAGASTSDAEKIDNGGTELSKASVVSIDSEVGLIVFDAGRRSGLRVGTPVTVLRGERPIYSAMIVDVRESISGAVLQDRMSDESKVEVGDGIRLLPEPRIL